MDDHRARLNECRDDDVYPSVWVYRRGPLCYFPNDENDGGGILMRNNCCYLGSDGLWQMPMQGE